ncbi:MAG: undecaprenyldiphospho-muramoylpentapeptide beta-N-acetylglucosaminyltransferase [Candidatus Yonathbacteria bacterium]|nr:undecaprenyldiphospho-muramoylpentapeptide beta-N-acetylglucosaminyltransferase [Candidatus Yonathbacteria bacterium]
MKVVFTGGGTGGHFYPIIAIIERLNELLEHEKLVDVEIYYLSDDPYDERILFENGVTFKHLTAGKLRRYFSFLNIIDLFKTIFGVIRAIGALYVLYPDVVVGKGGYASFPTLIAARILRIPVIIHESDSVPGRANIIASKFARRIAVSYPEAAEFFPKEKTAFTGNPIRRAVAIPMREGAHDILKLDTTVPVILILGGSQGAALINDAIMQAAPRLTEKYQIIHQVGVKNLEAMQNMAEVVMGKSQYRDRYKLYGYLNEITLRTSAGIADLVISRAGSTIFEIAAWGIPSIIIPITDSNGDHQRKNAYAYARSGGCIVIEEGNLTTNLITSEIERMMSDAPLREKMSASAKSFAKSDAAEKIAQEIVVILKEHAK